MTNQWRQLASELLPCRETCAATIPESAIHPDALLHGHRSGPKVILPQPGATVRRAEQANRNTSGLKYWGRSAAWRLHSELWAATMKSKLGATLIGSL